MKKISLLIVFSIAAFQLKAQQLFKLTTPDSSASLFQNHLKTTQQKAPLFLSGAGFDLQQNTTQKFSGNDFFGSQLIFTSMPVAIMHGYDAMPIVKMNSDDHMPLLNLGTIGREVAPQKILPGMPTFSSPTERN